MPYAPSAALGWWLPTPGTHASASFLPLSAALRRVNQPLFAVRTESGISYACSGQAQIGGATPAGEILPLVAYVPALLPEQLGDCAFKDSYGLQYAYVTGSMANGIASAELVEAMAKQGMLGFFGAAGLALPQVEATIVRLRENLGDKAHGFNLIHSPSDPALEAAIVDLYLRQGVCLIEASAFMSLTLPLLRFRFAGIHRNAQGQIVAPQRVMAKVSRLEMASKFLQPAPADMLAALVSAGDLTQEQAEWAATLPVCTELTAEADSGGHTDNRPAISMWPSMLELRDRIEEQQGYRVPLGAAGGISTPVSAAAAFAMGASYVVTGSINQACRESGSCDAVRGVLAKAGPADCTMAPAADMFEMGVNVQVLKWGTMFPIKARKLYGWYRQYNSFQEMPASIIAQIERDFLRCTIAECWASTKEFFAKRDPRQIAKAEQDPKHLMALVFRSYLGKASRWANVGEPTRQPDYQIWCGPAMGAFNEWVKGSFLENPQERLAGIVAANLMAGAAVASRVDLLRRQGLRPAAAEAHFEPQRQPLDYKY